MERLVLMLEVLVAGMRGARRRALEHVVEELKATIEADEADIEYESNLRRQRDEALNGRAECERLLGGARDRICQLEDEAARLRAGGHNGWMADRTWSIHIKRASICGKKIAVIKALREANPIGLKEAKEAVEAVEGGEGYAKLAGGVGPAALGCALSILIGAGFAVSSSFGDTIDVAVSSE
jgi:hypothetical protein